MHPKAHRMRRIFKSDGRTLIVAMDHAGFMGPVAGLIDPVATVNAVVAGGADAVMTTLGTAKSAVNATSMTRKPSRSGEAWTPYASRSTSMAGIRTSTAG